LWTWVGEPPQPEWTMTQEPIIRTLADADIDTVVRLWTECGLTEPWNDPRADIARARTSGAAEILVAADANGRIAATVMAGNDGHRGWLYYLAVAPDLQGAGLGRQMVMAAEDWLRARGVIKLMLMIRPSNAGVRGFYEALWRGGLTAVP
jgi:ribosomal protein S18 acetylase RimI-like enzyme